MELKNKKKILLAGFQPYDNTGYPPTKCFIDLIAEMHDLSFVSLPHLIPYSFLNIIINPGIIINHPFIVIKELFNGHAPRLGNRFPVRMCELYHLLKRKCSG